MDYTGRDFRNIRFPVDRPLTQEERAAQYHQKDSGNAPPMDFLSVIKVNSSYIDLVDRWYPITGLSVWLGACIAALGAAGMCIIIWAFFWAPVTDQREALWFMLIVLLPVSVAVLGMGLFLIRTECGRYTHYPMRLNRKTRQVHFFRQNGTVLTVPWDSLFLALGESKSPLAGTTYDLRAHVLGEDGETVRESFSLGYPSILGNAESIDKFWAFLQPYMEAKDGVEKTWRHLKENTGYLLPLDNRKEGWRWSIVQNYAWTGHWPWLQAIGSPVLGLNAVGRMLAMSTSKVPQWPEDVERESQPEANDPYVLTWRDNGPLGWWELYWPLICTVVGVGAFVGVIAWVVSGLWR